MGRRFPKDTGDHMRTLLLGPALWALLTLCACELNGPQAVSPDPAPGDKEMDFACPDDDGDGFSRISLCGPLDCNDEWNFYAPDQGYCPEFPFLEYDPPDDWPAADFALIRIGDDYHVFYIKGPFWQSNPETDGKSFGHAVTEDGLDWTDLADAFAVDPDSDWDDAHIWSPCVIRNPQNNHYYMFYTGVTNGPDGHEERIGLAWSPNLKNWTREAINECEGKEAPGCLWEPDFPWSAWSEPGYWTKQCRDPWVYRDEVAGCWYMVYSTARAPFDFTMVLGLARSDDLLHWTDCGPISCTEGITAESATMVRVDGLVHLLWTSRSDGGISHATAVDPETGPWSSPVLLPGSMEEYQVASELLDQGGWFIYGFVPDYPRSIRFKSMRLSGSGVPAQEPLAALGCLYIAPGSVHPGALEVDNGLDDNCNGLVDEGTGPCQDQDGDFYGDPASIYCPRLGRDCDDTDPAVHPGAVGSCDNGLDDNCNGLIDEPTECLPKFPALTSRY